MLKSNKKYYSFLFFLLLIPFFSILPLPAQAAPATQVKTADSPRVYFLSYKNGVKKLYINAAAYLSYGNKWSDIKIVSAQELAKWSDARLFRAVGSAKIYYISGHQKVLVRSLSDLANFRLVGLPVLEVSALDLAQYQEVSYVDIGWTNNEAEDNNSGSETGEEPSPGNTNIGEDEGPNKFTVYSEAVLGSNNNSLVTNTSHNLIGIFHFQAPAQKATVTAIALKLTGVYSAEAVTKAAVLDENGQEYLANVNWHQSAREILVNFREPLEFAASSEKIFKVFVDLGACVNCNNGSMRLELTESAAVQASAPITASWPLQGTQFKLLSSDNIIGALQVQAQSLAAIASSTSGSRTISKLKLSESSGLEDVVVKEIVFENGGSANDSDWNNFRLIKDGVTIARLDAVDVSGKITLPINYLRIGKNASTEVTLTASLLDDHSPEATYNIQVTEVTAVGATYNLNLTSTINNINESYLLN